MDSVEDKINKFFRKNKFFNHEKIALLQKWRYGLKDEMSAFRAGCFSKAHYQYHLSNASVFVDGTDGKNLIKQKNMDEEVVKSMKLFVENKKIDSYKEVIEDYYSFPDKIKFLEQMLVKEYAKAGHDIKAWSSANGNVK